MKKCLLIIVLVFLSAVALAQDVTGKISKWDIQELNRRIERQYRKFERKARRCGCDCVPPFDSVQIINLLEVIYEDTASVSKDFIASGEFLNYIKPSKITLKRRLFEGIKRQDMSMVVTKDGGLIAFYDGYELHLHDCDWEAEMARYIVQNDILSVYYFPPLNGFNYFGVDKNGKIHVFHLVFKTMSMSLVEDFPDEEWPKLFYGSWYKVLIKKMKYYENKQ